MADNKNPVTNQKGEFVRSGKNRFPLNRHSSFALQFPPSGNGSKMIRPRSTSRKPTGTTCTSRWLVLGCVLYRNVLSLRTICSFCLQAHRTLVLLKLKGLDHVISYSVVDSLLEFEKGCGWAFGEKYPDPHHPTFTHLKDVYKLNEPDYNGRVTVPVLFDLKVNKKHAPSVLRWPT